MVILKKIINTFFYPRFLFNLVINEKTYANLSKPDVISSWLKGFLYFYPTVIDAKTWMDGGVGKYRDPEKFLSLREGIDDFFVDYFFREISHEDKILDLGCNSGRHMNALHEKGYKKLTGVDVMESAFKKFRDAFPATYETSQLHLDFFQRFLDNLEKDYFDTVYTIGATIELVHPSYDVVKAMCRASRKNIILVIQPERHNYPRFYEHEFKRSGFGLAYKKKLSESHYLFHFIKNNTNKRNHNMKAY